MKSLLSLCILASAIFIASASAPSLAGQNSIPDQAPYGGSFRFERSNDAKCLGWLEKARERIAQVLQKENDEDLTKHENVDVIFRLNPDGTLLDLAAHSDFDGQTERGEKAKAIVKKAQPFSLPPKELLGHRVVLVQFGQHSRSLPIFVDMQEYRNLEARDLAFRKVQQQQK